jgi:hypothetical protein
MIECIFGWGKQHGTMRKTKHRGITKVTTDFMLNLIAYNLIRISELLTAQPTALTTNPVAPRARRQRNRKSATLQVLQRTARVLRLRLRSASVQTIGGVRSVVPNHVGDL